MNEGGDFGNLRTSAFLTQHGMTQVHGGAYPKRRSLDDFSLFPQVQPNPEAWKAASVRERLQMCCSDVHSSVLNENPLAWSKRMLHSLYPLSYVLQ